MTYNVFGGTLNIDQLKPQTMGTVRRACVVDCGSPVCSVTCV